MRAASRCAFRLVGLVYMSEASDQESPAERLSRLVAQHRALDDQLKAETDPYARAVIFDDACDTFDQACEAFKQFQLSSACCLPQR